MVEHDKEHGYLGDPCEFVVHGDYEHERPGYATCCILPDGNLGVFTKIKLNLEMGEHIVWVH